MGRVVLLSSQILDLFTTDEVKYPADQIWNLLDQQDLKMDEFANALLLLLQEKKLQGRYRIHFPSGALSNEFESFMGIESTMVDPVTQEAHLVGLNDVEVLFSRIPTSS